MSRGALLLSLWRAEGAASLAARLHDHLAAARRRRRFREVPLAALPAVPVLRVSAAPPVPWLGGAQAQLATLFDEQARLEDIALLYPWRGALRLEVSAGGRGLAASVPLAPAWAAAVRSAAAAVGASLLHVEGVAGLPLAALGALAREHPLLLSLHDFALFCPRPHLYDERAGEACGYCADAATCHARLAAAEHPGAERAWEWRQRGGELLAASRGVVYPSAFLHRTHERLFGSAGALSRVIAPGLAQGRLHPWRWPWAERSARPRIAFLGGGQPHKGARLLAAVIAAWARRGLPAVRWEVLGGGGPEMLRELRALPGRGPSPMSVRGYYRHGTLGRLLRRRCVELALLLPQVPESFSLVASECLAAGVPVMALAQGALEERLANSGGFLLPSDADAITVTAALEGWRDGVLPLPAAPAAMPTSGEAAAALASLYGELL